MLNGNYYTKVADNVQNPIDQHQNRETKQSDFSRFILLIIQQVTQYYWSFHLEDGKRNMLCVYMWAYKHKWVKTSNYF